MIRFLQAKGHRATLNKVKKADNRGLAIGLICYEDFLRAQRLRPATYVFTDLDRLSFWDLELVSQLYLRLKDAGFPVLNNPATAKKRFALLRALHQAGLNDFNAHRAEELPASMRFPVFLRRETGHGKPLSDLLHSREEVLAAMDRAISGGIPSDSLILVEYAGEPVREGQYQKLAAFRIGNEIVPHFSVNDRHWLVKFGRKDATIEDLYLKEQQTLATNPYAEHLRKVFDVAQIEYGRADFGFYKGRIQVFEINTNPTIPSPSAHPSATRMHNTRVAWEKYLEALHSIDSKTGSPVWFREKELAPKVASVMNHGSYEHKMRGERNITLQAELRTYREMLEKRIQAEQGAHLAILEKQMRESIQHIKYEVGTTIGFWEGGTRDLFIRQGWGSAESWGTWMTEPRAVLKICFRETPLHDLCLNVLLKTAMSLPQAPLRTEVRVNGEKLASWRVGKEALENFSLIIPAGKLKHNCEIIFKILNPVARLQSGNAGESRLPGLGIASVDLQWKKKRKRFLALFGMKNS